jgi:hypothetical protein
MVKYCPECLNIIDENDICFHYKKPHPRTNRAYHCSVCNEIYCWTKLIEKDEQFENPVELS